MRSASRLAGVGFSNPSAETSDRRSPVEGLLVRETGSLSLIMESSWEDWEARTAERISSWVCDMVAVFSVVGRESIHADQVELSREKDN